MTAFYYRPARSEPIGLLVSIPHTGIELPADVAARLAGPQMAALPMTDWHLHELYDFLPELGVETIYARYSRFVVDLNRPADGRALYPGRYETGVIPDTTFDGEPIFSEPCAPAAAEALREQYWQPYHRRLHDLLETTVAKHGRAVLVDAHSVASAGNRIHAALADDIYLGDRDGHSCDAWLTDTLHDAFTDCGLSVRRNAPYKGGYITDHYGSLPGVDAVQIEMCQRLYMNEARPHEPAPQRFDAMRRCLIEVFARLARELERS